MFSCCRTARGVHLYLLALTLFLTTGLVSRASAQSTGVAMSVVQPAPTADGVSVGRYDLLEARIDLGSAGTSARDLYWPFDPAPPAGVPVGTGVDVDALLLEPGQGDWGRARVQPCFWFQPMEPSATGPRATGAAHFRLRFAPDRQGVWQVKIRVSDSQGTRERL